MGACRVLQRQISMVCCCRLWLRMNVYDNHASAADEVKARSTFLGSQGQLRSSSEIPEVICVNRTCTSASAAQTNPRTSGTAVVGRANVEIFQKILRSGG